MDMELYSKLNELYQMLDELDCVKEIENIKNNIPSELVKMIEEYRLCPTSANKKKLYENEVFLQYIKCESELNYLIMEINNKFKRKCGQCESN